MDILNFTFRLLKHGSVFMLKLLGFVIGLFGGASVAPKQLSNGTKDEWHGIPNIEAVDHPMWDETYGTNRRPW